MEWDQNGGQKEVCYFRECALDASEIQRTRPVGTLALSSHILLKQGLDFFPGSVGFLNHQL